MPLWCAAERCLQVISTDTSDVLSAKAHHGCVFIITFVALCFTICGFSTTPGLPVETRVPNSLLGFSTGKALQVQAGKGQFGGKQW